MSEPMVQRGSVWATVKAVAWGFLGVRKGRGFQEDISKLKPYHIIAVGLIGGILLVLFLIGLVNWIVA